MNMFKDNRVGVFLLVVLVLVGVVTLVLVGLLLFNLGQRNASLEDENQRQDAIIQELLIQNRGPRGDDGLSAYEIWLSLGNEGSEQDFIDSLRGRPGTNGIDGRDGDSGKPGSNGLSIGSVKCNGTSVSFFNTNGQQVGSIKQVCIQ
jgi:hypothetical protein